MHFPPPIKTKMEANKEVSNRPNFQKERSRIEWPADGKVYVAHRYGKTWVGPSKAISNDQKELLKGWGKYHPGQLAYGGVNNGTPPIPTQSIERAGRIIIDLTSS